MRILHIVNSVDPVDGGPPAVVLRLASALALEGAQVTIYSAERPGRESEIVRTLEGIPGIQHVNRVSEVYTHAVDQLIARPAGQFFLRTEGNYDLVHAHGVWRPPLQVILRLARKRNRPFVISPHGNFTRWALAQKPWRKRIALALVWRSLTRHALFVHALTPAEASDFRSLAIDTPVEVLPNGFFPDEIGVLPAAGTFQRLHPELQGQRFILFLARLHYAKRVDFLVRAYAKLRRLVPDVRLVIAGPDRGARLQVETLLRILDLRERVHLVGPLYGPQKYAAMVDAVCFCQTSIHETFSMSILEAMACGLPPVITRSCNFDEVGTSGAGLVVDGDENALADALMHMCTNVGARDLASQRSRMLVREKYAWPVVAKKMLAAYEAYLCASSAVG